MWFRAGDNAVLSIWNPVIIEISVLGAQKSSHGQSLILVVNIHLHYYARGLGPGDNAVLNLSNPVIFGDSVTVSINTGSNRQRGVSGQRYTF